MDLKSLSDSEVLIQTSRAVETERAAIGEVIRFFQEASRRRLYLPTYTSLFEMLTKKYKYCAPSAQLRINAVRLLGDVPEVKDKLNSGELSLTAAANIQSFLYNEKRNDREYSLNAKIELIETCTSKSVRDVQKEFVRRNPEIEKHEFVRQTSEDRLRVSHSLSVEVEEKLKRIKLLWSHVDPNMSREQLLDRMAEITLDQIDPLRKIARREKREAAKDKSTHVKRSFENANGEGENGEAGNGKAGNGENVGGKQPRPAEKPNCGHIGDKQPLVESLFDDTRVVREAARDNAQVLHAHEMNESNEVSEVNDMNSVNGVSDLIQGHPLNDRCDVKRRSRYISAQDDREIRKANADGGCSFIDETTGERCGSHFQLQRDHVMPFSHGGANTASNLRFYCAQHNRWSWGEAATSGASRGFE